MELHRICLQYDWKATLFTPKPCVVSGRSLSTGHIHHGHTSLAHLSILLISIYVSCNQSASRCQVVVLLISMQSYHAMRLSNTLNSNPLPMITQGTTFRIIHSITAWFQAHHSYSILILPEEDLYQGRSLVVHGDPLLTRRHRWSGKR